MVESFPCRVTRLRGTFDSATIFWSISGNGTRLGKGEEFEMVEGQIEFNDGQTEYNLELFALADRLPEYNEQYTIQLVNITGKDITNLFYHGEVVLKLNFLFTIKIIGLVNHQGYFMFYMPL